MLEHRIVEIGKIIFQLTDGNVNVIQKFLLILITLSAFHLSLLVANLRKKMAHWDSIDGETKEKIGIIQYSAY